MQEKKSLSWQEIVLLGDIFSPRFGHSLIPHQSSLILFGGIDSLGKKRDCFRIHPNKNFLCERLTLKGEDPSLRFGFQSCLYENAIWLHGGNASMDGIYFNDLFRLDLSSLEWAKIEAENPHKGRIHHTFQIYKNLGVVLGGLELRTPLKEMLFFDFVERKWTAEKANKAIFGHSANVVGSEMVVFGGCDGKVLLKELQIFDFTSRTFEHFDHKRWKEKQCKGKIEPLFRHSADIHKEYLIVYGGMIDQQNYNRELYCLDLRRLEWLTINFQGYQPTPRNFHQSIILSDTYYIVGGYGGMLLNDTHAFKIPDNLLPFLESEVRDQEPVREEFKEEEKQNPLEWFKIDAKGSIPSARTGHVFIKFSILPNLYSKAFFEIQGTFYVFGGSGVDHLLNDLFTFDPKSRFFQKIATKQGFPSPRSGTQACTIGSTALLFGGYLNKDNDYYNDVYKFDPLSNSFEKLKLNGDPLEPLVDHTMSFYEKYVYIYGGKTPKYLSKNVFRINTEKNQVTNLKFSGDIPTPRSGHSADIYKANLYVFGGWNGQDTVDELFYFSLISNIWYEVRLVCGVKPRGRYRHATAVFEKSLFVFGGIDQKQHKFNDLYEFLLEKNEWRSVEVKGLIPSPRSFHQAICLENRFFVFGGSDEKKLNDFFCVILPSKDAGFENIPEKSVFSTVSLFENEKDKLNFMEGLGKGSRLIGLLREQVRELANKLRVEQERHLCKICFEKEINCVVLECGHKFSCFACSAKYQKSLFSLLDSLPVKPPHSNPLPPSPPKPAKPPLFLQNLAISFDYRKSEFSCSIRDKSLSRGQGVSNFSFSSPMIDYEELKSEKLEKLMKAELSLKGVCVNFERSGGFLSEERELILERANRRTNVKIHDIGAKISEPVQKTLFLICLQKDEKLACFQNLEAYIIRRGIFRMPFVEPRDFLLTCSEKIERLSLSEVMRQGKEQGNEKMIAQAVRLLGRLIGDFILNEFTFISINFQDFAYYKGKLGMRLINPENLIYSQGGVKDLKGIVDPVVWGSFFHWTDIGIFSLNKPNFNYFLLLQAYLSWKFPSAHDIYPLISSFFSQDLKSQETNSIDELLYSLFDSNSSMSIPESLFPFLEIPILDHSNLETQHFTLETPFKIQLSSVLNPLNYDPASELCQIQLSTILEFIDFQTLILKFENAVSSIKRVKSLKGLDPKTKWQMEIKMGEIQFQKEEYEGGVELLETTLKDVQNRMDAFPDIIAKTAHLLSLFHIQKNRFSEAINVLEIARSAQKKQPFSTIQFKVLFALGHLYREINKLDLSFKYFHKIETKNHKTPFLVPNTHTYRVFCETLGMIYFQKSEFLQARSFLEKALEIYDKRFTNLEKNEKYSNILNSLGNCWFELKNPEKALFFYEKSIEIKQNLFAQDYEKKGETMANLAVIYFELSDFKKAIEMNQKAIEIYSKTKEKKNLANSLNNLGLAYKSRMDFPNAIVNMKKALEVFETEYGKNDVLCGKTLNNIGMTYYDSGDISQAIFFCEKALEIYKLSSQDPQMLARALNNIGVLYTGNKDFNKAMDYYEKAIEIKKSGEPKNFVDIADSLSNLAHINLILKKYQKAKNLYQEIFEIRLKYLGESHKNSLETQRNLAECHFELQEFKEALVLYKQVRNLKRNLESGFEQSAEKAVVQSKIASCLKNLGFFVDSLMEFKVAIQIERDNDPANKKVLVGYLREYGVALREVQRFKESFETLKEASKILGKIKDKNEKEVKSLNDEIKKTKALLK